MLSKQIQSNNYRYHIIEGMLYLSTTSLISAQTVMPALIKRLGGSNVLVGTWPIIVYLFFFIPQIFSANYSSASSFRKPIVIRRGFYQRMHIIVLASVVAILGNVAPQITLILLFAIYMSNQFTAGLVSPLWMDFFSKTTVNENRGRILGWRTSLGALLGLLNGFLLTTILSFISFPYNYASIIAIAFVYQLSSFFIQRRIIEEYPSPIIKALPLYKLFKRVNYIIRENIVFRKFLISYTLITLSFSAVAFYTVASMEKFRLQESIIGVFTISAIIGQILSGILGWVSDYKGNKLALIICSGSLILSIAIAIVAPAAIWFSFVFILCGVYIGADLSLRYNFAVSCAPEEDRPMYIAIMNVWLAPLYLITPLIGLLSTAFGYNTIFVISLIIGLIGLIYLIKLPKIKSSALALSSK